MKKEGIMELSRRDFLKASGVRTGGRIAHEVGLLWHWGYGGLSTGDSANVMTPNIGDATTMIPEYKAFLVEARKA
jgi:hypothetical protein